MVVPENVKAHHLLVLLLRLRQICCHPALIQKVSPALSHFLLTDTRYYSLSGEDLLTCKYCVLFTVTH